jgi:hypothetical protein
MIATSALGQIEGFEKATTPAMVWLQPLNECLMFGTQHINHNLALPIETPITHMFQKDRKLKAPNSFVPCNCFNASQILNGEFERELVQSRPKIMGNLSNPDTPIIRRWRAIYTYATRIFPRLRIEFSPDDVITGFIPEGILHQGESLNFGFCTSDLEARAVQTILDFSKGTSHF